MKKNHHITYNVEELIDQSESVQVLDNKRVYRDPIASSRQSAST